MTGDAASNKVLKSSDERKPFFGHLEFSPVAQFGIDSSHRIARWNRACEILTGYPAKDMIGSGNQWKPFYASKRPTLADIVLESDRDSYLMYYVGEKLSRSSVVPNAWECVDYFKNVGGQARYLHILAAPIFEEDGRVIGAVQTILDITEQKNHELALIQSRKNYETLAEDLTDGFLLVQNGKIILANPAYAKMLGYSKPDELIGRKTEDFIAPSHREKFRKKLQAVALGQITLKSVQWPHVTRDGREIWIQGHPKLIKWDNKPCLLTTLSDVTEAKNRERAIEEEAKRLRKEVNSLKASMRDRFRLGNIIGKSPAMQEVYEMIFKAAGNEANTIIYGESGTGKELVAKAIHDMSGRGKSEFVPVNCGAIPQNLLESEFFGYKKGAFTGAAADKAGYLDRADSGTLFMDEIGELSLDMQVKLLRAIENQGYTPVGAAKSKTSDFRIIAATNRNLIEQVQQGEMREDFFYRIHIIPIYLPPLRNRREDIPLLADHFLRQFGGGRATKTIPGNVMELFYEYDWPGNVRELQNTLHRYVSIGKMDLVSTRKFEAEKEVEVCGLHLKSAVEALEKDVITRALQYTRYNRSRAATLLGIPRKTLYRKIQRYETKGNKKGQQDTYDYY